MNARSIWDKTKEVVGEGLDTVTGKAVIRDIGRFAQESDAINTAIVTRIYEILDRQKILEHSNEIANSRHSVTRGLVIASLAFNVVLLAALVLLLARLR